MWNTYPEQWYNKQVKTLSVSTYKVFPLQLIILVTHK